MKHELCWCEYALHVFYLDCEIRTVNRVESRRLNSVNVELPWNALIGD